jgi:plastocyanin
MSRRRSLRLLAGCAGVAALAAVILPACFSDHGMTEAQPATGSCQLPETPDAEGSTLVFISGFAFHPAQVHVRRGARVTWVNCEQTGGLSHTSTADAGAWHSPLVAPGATFTETFDAAGTFGYHCEPHPFMQGEVIVD